MMGWLILLMSHHFTVLQFTCDNLFIVSYIIFATERTNDYGGIGIGMVSQLIKEETPNFYSLLLVFQITIFDVY